MKALTLWEPWATLIMLGVKRFETRPWPLPAKMIGEEIAIHAAKTTPKNVLKHALENQHIKSALLLDPRKQGMHPGHVLGTVKLGKCYPTGHDGVFIDRREFVFGDYAPGRWFFEVQWVTRFVHPVAASGAQKFWEWKDG